MNGLHIIIDFLITTVLAGMLATAGMTLFMALITRSGITNADMVTAIGGIFTRSEGRQALLVGSLLHFNSGVLFAMVYTLILNYFGVPAGLGTLGVAILLGAFHGFVLSFLLVVAVAEHHPIERFKEAGIGVAVAHFVGHIVYGFLIGTVLTILSYQIV